MSPYSAVISFIPGMEVFVEDRRHVIVDAVDLESIRVRDYATGQEKAVCISDVRPAPSDIEQPPMLDGLSDRDMELATERYESIKPLLGKSGRTRAEVEERASALGLHANTLYKWLRLYENSRFLTSLVRQRRADKGGGRLPEQLEGIVREVIENEYLTKQKKSPGQVIREVKARCLKTGIQAPHANTIRNRLRNLPQYKSTARRLGRQAADEQFAPIFGSFPGANWPLAVVQMDHTQLDIILVDDIHRRPIGRPWITLAMDVFSRMVLGFYISFDPPGAASTGLCLAHAILPKEEWLAERDVQGDWPCWGLPKTVHVDNAKEFRGTMLQRACGQYGIEIEWRPVARPQFGGHVERLLGTLAKEIRALPGATFSNPKERGKYDSDEQAAFTFSEFEAWLTTYIVQVYHQRTHSALNMAPLEKYKEGVLGTTERPGVGIPARVSDAERLRLDFMPFVERTIQDYGVKINGIRYCHDVLRPWIGAVEKCRAKAKRKFVFRRDPRDISTIWFFDPELRTYYPIPYRDSSHPPISAWELREAIRRAKDEGRVRVDEADVFEAYSRMREIEDMAKAETKATRRAGQRRKMGAERNTGEKTAPKTSCFEDGSGDDIRPFEEMDELP